MCTVGKVNSQQAFIRSSELQNLKVINIYFSEDVILVGMIQFMCLNCCNLRIFLVIKNCSTYKIWLLATFQIRFPGNIPFIPNTILAQLLSPSRTISSSTALLYQSSVLILSTLQCAALANNYEFTLGGLHSALVMTSFKAGINSTHLGQCTPSQILL